MNREIPGGGRDEVPSERSDVQRIAAEDGGRGGLRTAKHDREMRHNPTLHRMHATEPEAQAPQDGPGDAGDPPRSDAPGPASRLTSQPARSCRAPRRFPSTSDVASGRPRSAAKPA